MARYSVLRNGIVENFVEWDGVSSWTAPAGTTVRLALPTDTIPVHIPTDDELLLAAPRKQRLAPTSAAGKPALRDFMDDAISGAQTLDWFNTKVQADGGVSNAAKLAVSNLATAAYQRAKQAVADWIQAT